MARKKKEEGGGGGSPAWMSTFSDLMNLLLCFFVLLFSMSSVDAEKFAEVMASIQSSFSILPSGGSALEEGVLISSGVSQLSELSEYYTSMGMNTDGDTDTDTKDAQEEAKELVEEQKMQESMEMAEDIAQQLEELNLSSEVELVTTSSYVMLNMNGGILFDSGSDQLKEEALGILDRIGVILLDYDGYIIEVVGHTDNVPIHSEKFPDNTMLSMCRAYSVYRYFTDTAGIDPVYMKSSGRGENVPIADNTTAEGRAQNRRVEIKIYNTFTTN
ncbi:MAG: flagellar motor protein MotB [Lachnospiraceae bacterium]